MYPLLYNIYDETLVRDAIRYSEIGIEVGAAMVPFGGMSVYR